MSIPTQLELITEFCGYVRDICGQPAEEQGNRLETVLARFADSSIRVAASTVVPADLEIPTLSNDGLAELMHRHVSFRRSAGLQLPNGAWDMMLEAAKRLRALTPPMRTEP